MYKTDNSGRSTLPSIYDNVDKYDTRNSAGKFSFEINLSKANKYWYFSATNTHEYDKMKFIIDISEEETT
jgi:hypothetical protein